MRQTLGPRILLCTLLIIVPIFLMELRPVVVNAQNGADELAIRDVIEQYNAASSQATDERDPSVEEQFTTDDFYQQLLEDMPAMWNRGVMSTTLMTIDWGPISVSGNTAMATTDEAWALAIADGSIVQPAPARNVYSLVRQDGTWKIQADDHPGVERSSSLST